MKTEKNLLFRTKSASSIRTFPNFLRNLEKDDFKFIRNNLVPVLMPKLPGDVIIFLSRAVMVPF